MGLNVALNAARASLMTSGIQSTIVSRNIAGADTLGYSRKSAALSTIPGSGVYVAGIQRAANTGVFYNVLTATSASSRENTVFNGIQRIAAETIDDPELDQSPAAMLSKLTNALQQFATVPNNVTLAQTAVQAAKDLATTLNQATAKVQDIRADADAEMKASVDHINQLLSQFESLNTTIVKGTLTGADVTDYLDQRDQILVQLSEEIGITVSNRANNDMVIYTDGGSTLFETRARAVTFDSTPAYTAGIAGNAVYVDGTPVTVMPIKAGKLVGLASLRDTVATTYQSQLDEVARGLIAIFAESDQNAVPTLPDVPGLFTWPGAPAIPANGLISAGLAGTIRVAASVDPALGGDPMLLRDGAISGNAAYDYNPTNEAGFSARLREFDAKLGTDRAFDPLAEGQPNSTLLEFAGSSVSWLEGLRQSTDAEASYQTTLLERSAQSLSGLNGVNMDDEMAMMLQIERTYAASSKLISTVDAMLRELLAAVR